VGRHVHLLDSIRGRNAAEIANALRLQLPEWKALCYEELSENARATYCRFLEMP
jgi:hypothetical protein